MRGLFLLLYGLSGAAGLIYEVLWTRQLTLLMGHTTAAASAVLAAFMGGLAFGAALGGRLASRLSERRALHVYGLVEFTIAAAALIVPVLLVFARPLLAATYADGTGNWFGLTRLAVSLVVLTVPSAAMGATLPLAARWYLRNLEQAGSHAGDLYAGNTIGAAIGAALAAFVFVPALGLRATLWIAASFNVIAGIGALVIARIGDRHVAAKAAAPRRGAKATAAKPRPQAQPKKTRKPGARSRPLPAADDPRIIAASTLAFTGFAALASEVVWTRVLALVIGPTTYAFGLMLTTFITGIGLGSWLGARITTRVRDASAWLPTLVVAFAVMSAIALWRIGGLPVTVAETMAGGSGLTFRSVFWRQGLQAASLLLPLSIVLGALFPLAVRVAARTREGLAQDLASLYSSNTIGAIAGSLLAGFLLIPWLGLRATLVMVIALASIGALIIAGAARMPRWRQWLLAAAGLAALFVSWRAPRWDQALLSSGAYKYAAYVDVPDVQTVLTAGTVEYYKEGATATVAVRRAAGATMLAIDGKIDASNASDMLTQRLLAHLPLLLHHNPKRVAIIGLGSGVTLGSALQHPIDRADVVEISREVVEASAQFSEENHRALEDRRARVMTGDGRTHLLLGRGQYDVIISEPSNPWVAGVATLFTREFFQAARRRLAAGGILCQWAHTYDIRLADLRSIAATFASEFPNGTLWLVGAGDLLFIGSDRPLDAELAEMASRMKRPDVAADLSEVSVFDAGSLLSMYIGGPVELQAFAAGAAVQSDDRTALEFSAPLGLYDSSGASNEQALRNLTSGASLPRAVEDAKAVNRSGAWRSRGQMQLQAEAYVSAYDAFARAAALTPEDDDALDGLVRAAAGAGASTMDAALALLRKIVAEDVQAQNVPARMALARVLAARAATNDAIDLVLPLTTSRPDDPRPVEQLAAIFADAGDLDRLKPLADQTPARMARPSGDAVLRRHGASAGRAGG